MKRLSSILMLSLVVMASACHKDDDSNDPSPSSGTDIRGEITSNLHLTKDKVWRLRGYVYVTNGVTLTIDAGTKIVSNRDSVGVLVIYKGAKIDAQGTASSPIVFTSAESDAKAGDLGGVIIVGQATGNGNHGTIEGNVADAYKSFGGNNDDDNSGILKYVRIEYAGKAVNPNDEVNGLSLYAVGAKTTIDYVQVIRGLDDAFEFFGGSVTAKHLIAYNCADDDFDMDDGFHGKIQFAVSIKNPTFTDTKTKGDLSNNFEVDNTSGSPLPFTTTPTTFPVLSNFTAIGPNNASGTSVDYGYGMRWRRGSKFILANSIVMGGQKAGLSLEDDITGQYYRDGISKFYNSFLNAYTSPFRVGVEITSIDSATVASKTLNDNKSTLYTKADDVKLGDPFNNGAPNLKPQAGSPAIASNVAKFDLTQLTDAFFEKVTYIGAFDGTNDWTTGWTAWNK